MPSCRGPIPSREPGLNKNFPVTSKIPDPSETIYVTLNFKMKAIFEMIWLFLSHDSKNYPLPWAEPYFPISLPPRLYLIIEIFAQGPE